MNYANIKYCDIANGQGVRTSLFVSGCTHHCEGCFNAMAWDFDYGEPFTDAVIEKILASLAPDYIAGLTILGGEPMEPENQEQVLHLCEKVKEKYPNKTIWLFSGYRIEQLAGEQNSRANTQTAREILKKIDVLVDGEFVQSLYDISLQFRGSSNQRILDMKKTREENQLIWWETKKKTYHPAP